MPVTIKGSMPGAINDAAGASVAFNAMSAKVADAAGTVIGTATTVTRDSSGMITFAPTGSYNPSLIYYAYLVKTSDGEILTRRAPVWIESSNGTYYFEDFAALARFQESIAKNLQAVERSTDDTRAIEFTWPVAGDSAGSANIGGTAGFTTKTRRFKPLATVENISGAITFVGSINGEYWWKLAYNINDRADDGATVIPAEIEYALTDNAGRTGTMTLIILPQATIEGDVIAADIVTALTGVEPRIVQLFDPRKNLLSLTQSDDYSYASGTAIDIPVNLPTGVAAAGCKAKLSATRPTSVSATDPNLPQRLDITNLDVVEVVGVPHVRFVATKTQTTIDVGMYDFQLIIEETSNQRRSTRMKGRLDVGAALVPVA
jgi:hypothetical protein